MRGRERPVVPRVHRLEHVQRLTAADLADDDPVGSHPEGVAHELADGHPPTSLDVGRARLERDDVGAVQPELRSVRP